MISGSWLLLNRPKLLIPALLFALLVIYQRDSRPRQQAFTSQGSLITENLDFRDGDLIFRTRNGFVSQIVLSQRSGSLFSHVGILLQEGEDWRVVHAIPNHNQNGHHGVVIEAIETFLDPITTKEYAVYRYPKFHSQDLQKIRQYAHAQVGKAFDDRFLLSSDEQLYCSELVLKAFDRVGVQGLTSLPRASFMLMNETIILPDAILNIPSLSRIH